jgi:hypothetical protein
MFKNLTPAEAGRLDSVLFDAIMVSDGAGKHKCADDALDALIDLRTQHGQVDPTTLGFRLEDV